MNIKSVDISKNFLKMSFIIISVLILTFVQNISAQDDENLRPINLSQVETALRNPQVPSAKRNSLLIEGVGKRKITFWLTAENEKKLRLWGANNILIEAVKKNQQPFYEMTQKDLKLNKPLEMKNSAGIEFVLIPAGDFLMGLAKDEKAELPYEGTIQHTVKIKQDFYLGKYEITQSQYKALTGKNPSEFQNCGECPVENIRWTDAQAFIKKLNEKNDGFRYRLPTEAEWEYADRAGATTKFFWGDDAERKNWNYYAHNSRNYPAKIGSYLPNAFGLYDMNGNVWEFCEDVWKTNFKNASDESAANSEGDASRKVIRGGGWGLMFDELRASKRNDIFSDGTKNTVGFRVAATILDPLNEPKTIIDDQLNSKATTPLEIASNIKGEVKVSVLVDENGKVTSAKIISGHPLLTEKALSLAKEAKFQKMIVDGKPVKVQGVLTFKFK